MNNDNIYFLNTPSEIEDEVYYEILEKLEEVDIDNQSYIYIKFTQVFNLPNKYFFKVYISKTILGEDINVREPDLLIFLS